MADKWVAECAPCNWVSFHDTQDEAIDAVDQHIEDLHRKTPAGERTAKRIGHVQFRTVTEGEPSTAAGPHAAKSSPEAPSTPDHTSPEAPPHPDQGLPAPTVLGKPSGK